MVIYPADDAIHCLNKIIINGPRCITLFCPRNNQNQFFCLPCLFSQRSKCKIIPKQSRPNPEVVGSNPTEVKFSLTRGDSQISFKGVIPKGDLVYRQYCLLPAPKHILKIISRQGAPGRRATCLACKRFDAFSKETYEK